MAFQLTSIYAAILALAAITLSVVVSLRRARQDTSILDDGHVGLALAIRRHGFIETVPLTRARRPDTSARHTQHDAVDIGARDQSRALA